MASQSPQSGAPRATTTGRHGAATVRCATTAWTSSTTTAPGSAPASAGCVRSLLVLCSHVSIVHAHAQRAPA